MSPRNPPTGDFDAVMQVSGGTVNRLVATMHQNGFADKSLPSLPHKQGFWIKHTPAQGVHGFAEAQVSVPTIELIDGATDRFALELSVRARFHPSPGSAYFPEYIYAKSVRAEYALGEIGRNCPGWEGKGDSVLWFRVDEKTIKVKGLELSEASDSVVRGAPAASEKDAKAIIVHLLKTEFAPSPQEVSDRFRRGSMASLNRKAGHAVVIPVAGSGDVRSVSDVFLDSKDLALAVRRSLLDEALKPMIKRVNDVRGGFSVTFTAHLGPFDVDTYDVNYDYRVTGVAVAWDDWGDRSGTTLTITIDGRVDNDDDFAASATFTATQDIDISFDGGGGGLLVSPGNLATHVHASGIGHGTAAQLTQNKLRSVIPPIVDAACSQAQAQLRKLTGDLTPLNSQLRKLDAKASARFREAEFTSDTVILRGTISVTKRKRPKIAFATKPERSEFDALESWIPGGRIDTFEWGWRWFGFGATIKPGGQLGAATFEDRFVLRRSRARRSPFGARIFDVGPREEIPGLDGSGRVCLVVSGRRVDDRTGELVPFVCEELCGDYGWDFLETLIRARLKDIPEIPIAERGEPGRGPRPLREAAIFTPGNATGSRFPSNVLAVQVREGWDESIATTLRGGFDDCHREDAGLLIFLLLREGMVDKRLIKQLEKLGEQLPATLMAYEDTGGRLAEALEWSGGGGPVAWRLYNPGGGITWDHAEHVSTGHLAEVLNTGLLPSGMPIPVAWTPGHGDWAVRFPERIPHAIPEVDPNCPPVQTNPRNGTTTTMAFVRADSESSRAELERLRATRESEDATDRLIVVVGGAGPRQAAAVRKELAAGATVLADPHHIIASAYDVRLWPTTFTLDDQGQPEHVRSGAFQDIAGNERGE